VLGARHEVPHRRGEVAEASIAIRDIRGNGNAEALRQNHRNAHRGERIAAEIEEIIVRADDVDSENLPPALCHLLLQIAPKSIAEALLAIVISLCGSWPMRNEKSGR